MADETEIAIVGAGAAGSILAARLAQAGRKVVVLESGPPWKRTDLVSSQLWARRLKWGGDPVRTTGRNPINVGFNSGHGFGGAAIHHYATWLRLHVEDFRVATTSGRFVDWPMPYDDLRPHYDRVQREVGLSGDTAAEVWRPPADPYPMKPLFNGKQADTIARGFTKLGMRTAPMPHAINSVPFNGRPACLYDGWCDAGCPTGALANPLVTYLPAAQKAGAEIRPYSTVTRLETNANGSRVTGVAYRDRDGQEHILRAAVTILASFAVQTPRLLLNSATPRHPDGLANSSGAIGRYVMTLPVRSVFGLFEEDTAPYAGVTSGTLMTQDQYDRKSSREVFGSRTWLIGQAVKPNDLLGIASSRADLFGNELHDFMKKAAHRIGNMVVVTEDHPSADNRLTLADEKDRFGMRLARVEHGFSDEVMRHIELATSQGLQVLRTAGATEVWPGAIGSQNIYGTTRMGSDPKTSVANANGQTHDVPNLFIAGASLFPTTGAVAATYTINALASKTADFIARSWNRLKA
jgi:choline dehydrogenase-like flavoprotein